MQGMYPHTAKGLWLLALLALAGLVWANVRAVPPVSEKRLAGYTTSLKGRKRRRFAMRLWRHGHWRGR